MFVVRINQCPYKAGKFQRNCMSFLSGQTNFSLEAGVRSAGCCCAAYSV